MRIVVIGSGNAGWHIARRLWECGTTPVQVYSRSSTRAHALAGKISTRFTTDLSEITDNADVYLIVVPDDAIASVTETLHGRIREGAVVAHSSGSVPSEALKAFPHYGVFYPLQTFSIGRTVDWDPVPLLLTANSDTTLATLFEVAKCMQCTPQVISDAQRGILHLAATVACNFSNHMYAIAGKLLTEHDLDFDLLKPLIRETAAKVQQIDPKNAQTGPAIRGDQHTLKKHLNLLHGNPQLAILYALISRHIQED